MDEQQEKSKNYITGNLCFCVKQVCKKTRDFRGQDFMYNFQLQPFRISITVK